MLDSANPPSAIFTANDVSAIAAMEAARSLGLAVPRDLSLIGFDNVPESALCEPPLTTIEQPIQQMGFEAVELLIGLVEKRPDLATQRLLPTKLIVRGSCSAPGSG
jgi:LacI family transcriptional regulator